MTPEQARTDQSSSGRLGMTPEQRRAAMAKLRSADNGTGRVAKLFGRRPMIVTVSGAETPRPANVTERIVREVCRVWDIDRAELMSRRRHRVWVEPRCAAAELMRTCTSLSLPAIGRLMLRDHTTIMNQLRRHSVLLERQDYAERFATARLAVAGGNGR